MIDRGTLTAVTQADGSRLIDSSEVARVHDSRPTRPAPVRAQDNGGAVDTLRAENAELRERLREAGEREMRLFDHLSALTRLLPAPPGTNHQADPARPRE